MSLYTGLTKVRFLRRINTCFLCNEETKLPVICEGSENKVTPKQAKPKLECKVNKTHVRKHFSQLTQFFDENPSITYLKNYVPMKVLKTKPYKNPETVYLVCPSIAKDIARHIIQRLQGLNQVIAESNPGFGLITQALIQEGIQSVRLYEFNHEFQNYLQEVFGEDPCEITLCKRDFFALSRYEFFDNIDQGERVSTILQGVPKKSWNDDPVMTIIGTITRDTFLKYLVKCIVLQREPVTNGRIDLFLITYEKLWKMLTANKYDSARFYKSLSILMQIFFEAELIDKFTRKFFLPWETSKKVKRTDDRYDTDHLYLIKLSMRKNLPFSADHFVPFYSFMVSLYGRGNSNIIPTCEKWVPGSGEHVILPKLAHEDYYEDLDIFTRFKELNPMQIVAVYRELSAHPDYSNSPFMDMVEQDMLKSETIDTYLNDAINQSNR